MRRSYTLPQSQVSIGFRAPSRNFKILAIPNVLAHGKSYEHGFVKNLTVLNFARSRVSIGFSCTISEF
ncbi:hypothetical protein B296_00024582 [Ensete ventricosum]|uniref:Uncharacterized protein n=1 Tax=Ensete ventricosum TaxID=4639 RepID=A0A426ZVV7_ENSVE|nr:hypothetical protein B296_00024582 [Ensete ventricosum]